MLTSYDVQVMENDVRDIIQMWNTKLTVLKPLPIERQPNWNEHMHEYSDVIHYVQFDNVSMERKDQIITNTYTIDTVNGAGDQKDGFLVFTTSDLNTFIDDTCRLCYKGEQWAVRNLYPRIGETIIAVFKLSGSDEKWADTPDIIVDVDKMPADEEHGDIDYDMFDSEQTGNCNECGICGDIMAIGGDGDV